MPCEARLRSAFERPLSSRNSFERALPRKVPPTLDDAADVARIERADLIVDQALKALPHAVDGHALIEGAARDGANGRIHAGGVAAAGQDRNAFHAAMLRLTLAPGPCPQARLFPQAHLEYIVARSDAGNLYGAAQNARCRMPARNRDGATAVLDAGRTAPPRNAAPRKASSGATKPPSRIAVPMTAKPTGETSPFFIGVNLLGSAQGH